MEMESDEQLRDRILALIPDGDWHNLKDVSDASGKNLDALAIGYGVYRQRLVEPEIRQSYQDGWADGYNRGRQDAFKDIKKMKSDMRSAVLKALKEFGE